MRFLRHIQALLIGVSAVAAQALFNALSPVWLNFFSLSIVVMLTWLLLAPSRKVIVIALAMAFILEIFSAVPSGSLMASVAISLLAVWWLITTLFTNRSVYMAACVGGFGLLLYYLSAFGGSWISALAAHRSFVASGATIAALGKAWLASLGLLIALYLTAQRVTRWWNPLYIKVTRLTV